MRGGSHEGMGTANFIIGLGTGAYLGIIGPDLDQPQPVGGRWFGIDRLTAPRIVTWAIRTADIDGSVAAARALGYDPGQPTAMSRRSDAGDDLQWRLTPLQIELNNGLVPFLIDWGSTPYTVGGEYVAGYIFWQAAGKPFLISNLQGGNALRQGLTGRTQQAVDAEDWAMPSPRSTNDGPGAQACSCHRPRRPATEMLTPPAGRGRTGQGRQSGRRPYA